MKTDLDLEKKVRRKISGWYANEQYTEHAVLRIMKQRNEIINLLRSTNRNNIENVIKYLDESGFYYRASSPNGHHNYPGGLAEHSLGTYREAAKNASGLPEESVIIAALLHDICKSDRFWFKGREIRMHSTKNEIDDKHSVRSIAIIKNCEVNLSNSEYLAIRWHMKGVNYQPRDPKKKASHDKAIKDPLWNVVFYADKKDAKMHPAL